MTRRPLTVTLLTIATAASLAACTATAPADGEDAPRTLTLAPIADVASFSPQKAGDGHAVQWTQPVYDTLIRQLPDGTYTGMLASDWSYDETNTVLTLDLVDGVTFSDGTPLDATAVAVNLEATRDGTGALSTQLASISDIEVVDDDTIALHLTAPDPSLVRGLSQPSGMIANPAKVGGAALETTPDGTGPYELDLERTVRGSEYVFVKKDDYWNTELELPYDELVYRPMTELTARVNALQAGEIDGAYIDTTVITQLEGAGLDVVTYPAAGVVGLFLLDRAGTLQPALGDVRVRQAINYALDREGMLATYRAGLGTVTSQVFNPLSDAVDASLDESYPYDPEKARDLLAAAGYADGFTLQMPDISVFAEGTIIAQQLADVGITVEWIAVAPTELLNEMRSGKYPAIFMQLQATDPWQTIQFFVSPSAPWNVLGSEDAVLTALIAEAQGASGDAQTDAYLAIDEYLVENAWFAPFYFPDNVYATSADTTVTAQYQQGVPSIYNFAPAS